MYIGYYNFVSDMNMQERNFHIFYYLFAGLPQEKIKSLQLKVIIMNAKTMYSTCLSISSPLHVESRGASLPQESSGSFKGLHFRS